MQALVESGAESGTTRMGMCSRLRCEVSEWRGDREGWRTYCLRSRGPVTAYLLNCLSGCFSSNSPRRQLIDTVVTSKHAKEKDGKVKVFNFYLSAPLCLLAPLAPPAKNKVVCMHVLLTPTTPFESKYREYLYNNRVKFARYQLHSTPLIPINQSR
jgi:hypothetical protein